MRSSLVVGMLALMAGSAVTPGSALAAPVGAARRNPSHRRGFEFAQDRGVRLGRSKLLLVR